ncbi:MAG: hypothetical protein HUJ90_04750 [Bacteroidales bacterium]|nr:hypothetical protein [Bacteroidales bacterium]
MRKIVVCILLFVSFTLSAQFRTSEGNLVGGPPGADSSQGINKESDVPADTVKGFSLKVFYQQMIGQQQLAPGYALMGGALLPGSLQIHNKDYYKLPILYGGIATGLYFGISNGKKYKQTQEQKFRTISTLGYVGAGLFYWGSLMDGVVRLPNTRTPDPAKAAVFSALLPGLGQAYNGDWWHIPIWYGGLAVCAYAWKQNDMQYKRFRYIYEMASAPNETGYIGSISASQAQYYKDSYRRYRDFSIVATILVYALNIVDANIFAYMSDFNVNDDLTMNIEPTLISPLETKYYASNVPNAFGLQMNFNF